MWRYTLSAAMNFASILLSLAARLVILFQFGPVAFGAFTVWYNNAMLFGLMGTAGYQNFALREIARARAVGDIAEGRAIARDGVRVMAVGGALAGLAAALFFVLAQAGTIAGGLTLFASTALIAILTALSAVHRARGYLLTGPFFDRVLYQTLFIATLLSLTSWLPLAGLETVLFLAALAIAAFASVVFLMRSSALGWDAFFSWAGIPGRLRRLAPYGALVAAFTANGRYLLGIAGIVFAGSELGKVSFDFTYASIIALPTATFNLVFGPPIARAIAAGDPVSARRRALSYVALNLVSSLAAAGLVLLTYSRAIEFASVTWNGSFRLISLLAISTAISGATNGLIIIAQFQGRAARTAKNLTLIFAVKLLIGAAGYATFGFDAFVMADIAFGAMFFALILSGSLAEFANSRRSMVTST